MYDYLIVGAGLFGASLAARRKKDHKVLVIEKLPYVGGAIRTERKDDIDVHVVGPHIFHTSDSFAWNFFDSYGKRKTFINEPLAFYKGKYYHRPFNRNTFKDLWGITEPEEAKKKIQEQIDASGIKEPKNLEEQAIKMVGKDIFEILVKGYTEKQWGRSCKELPPSIIKRLPVRFTYNNNYFNDTYSGIPREGYTKTIENRLEGVDVILNADFLADKEKYRNRADKVIYTGPIDAYFDYRLGHLEYRTLRFETKRLEQEYYQKSAVVNYTDREVPYTRICEHKHFRDRGSKVTYITREYPKEFAEGDRPLYPINNEKNKNLYLSYKELSEKESKVCFAGRLGSYSYYDRDDTVLEAKKLFDLLTK